MPALRITTLAAACLLGALSPLGQPASALATPSGQNRLEPGGKASCLNLPISSIEMQPTSCWVTSPTSSVVAGTNSHNAQDGVIYVIQDQQRRRLDLPRAGRLTITGVTNRTACLRDASGGLVGVDLVSGAVGSCAAPAGRSQPAASAEVIPQVNAAAAAPPPTTVLLRLCGLPAAVRLGGHHDLPALPGRGQRVERRPRHPGLRSPLL